MMSMSCVIFHRTTRSVCVCGSDQVERKRDRESVCAVLSVCWPVLRARGMSGVYKRRRQEAVNALQKRGERVWSGQCWNDAQATRESARHFDVSFQHDSVLRRLMQYQKTDVGQCRAQPLRTWFTHRQLSRGRPEYVRDLVSHLGCVNCIEFSNGAGSWLASGSDDTRVLVWDLFRPSGPRVVSELPGHVNSVFGLAFDGPNEHLISCGIDGYVLRFDLEKSTLSEQCGCYHEDSVSDVAVAPHAHVLTLAAMGNAVVLIDFRAGAHPQLFHWNPDPTASFISVKWHPTMPELYAACDTHGNGALFDVRNSMQTVARAPSVSEQQQRHTPDMVQNYGVKLLGLGFESGRRARTMVEGKEITGIDFDHTGEQLVCLAKNSSPVVFGTFDPDDAHVLQSSTFLNRTTMKGVSFGGADSSFVLAGSDDFGVYVWRTPKLQNHRGQTAIAEEQDAAAEHSSELYVLHGHRSIVNNVRMHPVFPWIASAGVEKMVRLWSALPFAGTDADEFRNLLQPREVARHGFLDLGEAQNDGAAATQGARLFADLPTTDESPRTISMFDYLIQMNAESADSEDTSSADEPSLRMLRAPHHQRGDASEHLSTSQDVDNDDDDRDEDDDDDNNNNDSDSDEYLDLELDQDQTTIDNLPPPA
ncbi:DDB1- and CUL4-associated factor 5 [Porphyridium purpureum]|uniref:DDB1-and CUL4-associated factor 5 n=1 Tax=Porphyridium purpureum TaxID=35688 RepID=A0A5J4YQC2_PORPP|nr:DDB1- and CUL4-associated factor 5 [Porphyridium purpureum]|eukprot:POR3908..scf296_7